MRVVSHPGITYGGLVHDGSIRGSAVIEVLARAREVWSTAGYRTLLYKVVPYFYHRVPSGDDIYALFRHGATLTRCDLSTTLDLAHPIKPNRNRRRNLKQSACLRAHY